MDNRLFRDAMGKFATGVTIVTTEIDNEILGMTVNAFMSISLEPKLIAISIDEGASMYWPLQETKKFGVSILSEHQKEISMYYAKHIEHDIDIDFSYRDQIPVINNALATVACRVTQMIKAGDHMIFIAEVTDLHITDEKEPLLYYSGEYRTL